MRKHRSILLMIPAVLMAGACATTDTMTATGAIPESNIAAVISTAHEGEVMHGEGARSKASREDVRAFASMMVTDHTAAGNRAREVFARNNITPMDNDTSRTLRDNARRAWESLNTYSGVSFDRAYMQAQVDMHQWMLTSLDNNLIPSARNREMRELLTAQRGSVMTHLERARNILNGIR